jgi:hypothetical protein
MSNALGIGPAVMINRLVHESGKAGSTHLAEVARLRADLHKAVLTQQAAAADLGPDGKARAPVVSSGADVDRLV